MWNKIECVAIYTEDIEKSVQFYQSLGLSKNWETLQDEDKQWNLIVMKFPDGNSELVLKNNPRKMAKVAHFPTNTCQRGRVT